MAISETRRKDEVRPLVRVSALCSLDRKDTWPVKMVQLIQNGSFLGQVQEKKSRRNRLIQLRLENGY